MGRFYSNYTLRGPSQPEVASALAGRSAFVTHAHNGCVVVYDEASEAQDFAIIRELGARLSLQLRRPVLAAVVHDDDILFFQLYEGGEVTDDYDSSPGYFDAEAEPSAPDGGDADRLCAAFGTSNAAEVSAILRKSTYDDDGPFATDRHAPACHSTRLTTMGSRCRLRLHCRGRGSRRTFRGAATQDPMTATPNERTITSARSAGAMSG